MTQISKRASGRSGRRSGKVRLDQDSIIAAALEVSRESRGSTLHAKELGVRLGVDPTSIYRHFRNKQHLMEALLDELNARSVRAVTAPPEQWQERLRQLARSTLVEYRTHPAIAAGAMVLTTHGAGEHDAIELMLDAFTRAGLDAEGAVQHYALLSTHILSVASGIAIAHADSDSGLDDDAPSPWYDGPILADPRTHPRIAQCNLQLAALEDRELFMRGVEAVIQSAERLTATPNSVENAAVTT